MTKKFKLLWDERVVDQEGDCLHTEQKSQIIEAESEDAACAQWGKENEHNEYQNGLDDVYEIVETPLFAKHLYVDMPDGNRYKIPVEMIARHRAEHYANKDYDGDIAESLRDDTIPLFLDDDYEIEDWAVNNMNWDDVKAHATIMPKQNFLDSSVFQEAWIENEKTIK